MCLAYVEYITNDMSFVFLFRLIYHESKRYEIERGISNKSTYWVTFELLCRDFFRFLCTKHGNRIFFQDGAEGGRGSTPRKWSTDADKIARWKTGTTGQPLVDANMRELMHTGKRTDEILYITIKLKKLTFRRLDEQPWTSECCLLLGSRNGCRLAHRCGPLRELPARPRRVQQLRQLECRRGPHGWAGQQV